MAEQICNLSKGKGSYEVKLLASGSPQSSWGQKAQVSLSESISNFKEILGIEYNSNDGNAIVNERVPVALFKNSVNVFGVYAPGTSVVAGLRVQYLNDTSVNVASYGYTGYRIYGIR